MPKIFTHFCRKINLSLLDNTLSIYPKQSRSFNQRNNRFHQLSSPTNFTSFRVAVLFKTNKEELGITRVVGHTDPDVHLFHQNGFNHDDDHYHYMFAKTINESKLNEILDFLVENDLITSQEHNRLLKDYQKSCSLHDSNEIIKISDFSFLIPHDKELNEEEKALMSTSPSDRFNLIL